MHTKGHWKKLTSQRDKIYIEDSNGKVVAIAVLCDEMEANALLIAAAPELLEALDKIAGYTNAWPDGLSAGDAYDMQAIARQAIRKAKSHADTLKGK